MGNTAFPFRKYRPDFTPYAPHQSMYDAVKYAPNPDWLSLRPWAHKFRAARYVYVPSEENSSKSLEMERIMREARMRELCKGLYSSTYEDSINSKVAGKLRDEPSCPLPDISLRSFDAETAPSNEEVERKKPHLTSAEKRKRNETLAIGISRAELLKPEAAATTGAGEPEQDQVQPSDGETLEEVRASEDAEKAAKEEAERVAQEVMTRLAEEKARAAVEAEGRAKAIAEQEKEAAARAEAEAKAAAEEVERLKAEAEAEAARAAAEARAEAEKRAEAESEAKANAEAFAKAEDQEQAEPTTKAENEESGEEEANANTEAGTRSEVQAEAEKAAEDVEEKAEIVD